MLRPRPSSRQVIDQTLSPVDTLERSLSAGESIQGTLEQVPTSAWVRAPTPRTTSVPNAVSLTIAESTLSSSVPSEEDETSHTPDLDADVRLMCDRHLLS
ncbi:hypothetical protein F1559_002220 [Cyanidiococcus yangmingshanensis]|uniref:Uncharacterized protein n=1 Tax=Cyanidiococcus yangmingshanensis TaxID=2690220 RepID=A0A7J7IDF4_9RHOD|nr:hypothetical protein F1559_002220 [Cyanidiococcus yangmingshanensis]